MPPLVPRSGEIEAVMLNRLFRGNPARELGEQLYAACVRQAREPALYEGLGVPDTVEGRFEAYTLHVVLLLERLAAEGEAAQDASQALFDTYVKALDHTLRELGVGDLSVGKKMRRLGEALYGRMKNYQAAFQDLPQTAALRDVLTRTVYAGEPREGGEALAAHVVDLRTRLAAQPLAALLAGEAPWSAT
jgi:cytochrome b pre-mRNA-processing protein 3